MGLHIETQRTLLSVRCPAYCNSRKFRKNQRRQTRRLQYLVICNTSYCLKTNCYYWKGRSQSVLLMAKMYFESFNGVRALVLLSLTLFLAPAVAVPVTNLRGTSSQFHVKSKTFDNSSKRQLAESRGGFLARASTISAPLTLTSGRRSLLSVTMKPASSSSRRLNFPRPSDDCENNVFMEEWLRKNPGAGWWVALQ